MSTNATTNDDDAAELKRPLLDRQRQELESSSRSRREDAAVPQLLPSPPPLLSSASIDDISHSVVAAEEIRRSKCGDVTTAAVHSDDSKLAATKKATTTARRDKMLAKAKSMLHDIDESLSWIQQQNRLQPQKGEEVVAPTALTKRFKIEEVAIGEYLGEGGYCTVHAVEIQNNESNADVDDDAAAEPCYAIKRLKDGSQQPDDQIRGMLDLATEAMYLSMLSHDHIINLCGMADGPMLGNIDFFLILDRLQMTLDEKKEKEWTIAQTEIMLNEEEDRYWFTRLVLGPTESTQKALNQLMEQRIKVMYLLANAFNYMHSSGIVYRDIKATNIGFDMRGDVKIFDFGFCKSLTDKLKADDGKYGYKLTGRVGSFPYMGPEVFKSETYNEKCDVFSFAVLLWEILSLDLAWKQYSADEFIGNVYYEEERSLTLPEAWPLKTRSIITKAWDPNPSKRPDMQNISHVLDSVLKDMRYSYVWQA